MSNDKEGKIYAIKSHHTTDFYIGSSYRKYLTSRLSGHVSRYRRFREGKEYYTSSFEVLKHGNYYIECLENCGNITKQELMKKEREYIQNSLDHCVNLQFSGRTKIVPNHMSEETLAELRKYSKKHKQTYKSYLSDEARKLLKENALAYNQEYNKKHKEELREKRQQSDVRERRLVQRKLYREKNKEAIKAYYKKYMEKKKAEL